MYEIKEGGYTKSYNQPFWKKFQPLPAPKLNFYLNFRKTDLVICLVICHHHRDRYWFEYIESDLVK